MLCIYAGVKARALFEIARALEEKPLLLPRRTILTAESLPPRFSRGNNSRWGLNSFTLLERNFIPIELCIFCVYAGWSVKESSGLWTVYTVDT